MKTIKLTLLIITLSSAMSLKSFPNNSILGTWKSYKLMPLSKIASISDSLKSNFHSIITFNKDSTYSKITNGIKPAGKFKPDGTKLVLAQERLNGCWKTSFYQFKYDKEKNQGIEYNSKVHSSAPIFQLKIKDHELYIEWLELTGGMTNQKILRIKNKKLILKGDNGQKVVYKKTKDCS